jgi:hypothetical protein
MQRKEQGQFYNNVKKISGQNIIGTVQFKAQNIRNRTLSRTLFCGPKSPSHTILWTKQFKAHSASDHIFKEDNPYRKTVRVTQC